MNYIYCYTNKLNNHKYVGQTNNFKRRKREHSSCSFNPKASSYNDLIHQKIREYGLENFEVEVLEILYTNDQSIVDEREIYWIDKLESFCGTGKGYNRTIGGQGLQRGSRIFTKEEIKEIKEQIKQGVSFLELECKYNISASFLSSLNHGYYLREDDETYPLYKYYKEDKDYDELVELLINSNLPLTEIAKQLGMGYSTVKKINAGTLRKGLYPSYPIRKTKRADRIKEALINGKDTVHEIMKKFECSYETVRRINVGETFKDSNLNYPLRSSL